MVAVTEQQQEAQEESPKADSGATAITSEDGVKQASADHGPDLLPDMEHFVWLVRKIKNIPMLRRLLRNEGVHMPEKLAEKMEKAKGVLPPTVRKSLYPLVGEASPVTRQRLERIAERIEILGDEYGKQAVLSLFDEGDEADAAVLARPCDPHGRSLYLYLEQEYPEKHRPGGKRFDQAERVQVMNRQWRSEAYSSHYRGPLGPTPKLDDAMQERIKERILLLYPNAPRDDVIIEQFSRRDLGHAHRHDEGDDEDLDFGSITTLEDLSWKTALGIGCFQVLSLVPGTSRSGSTIIGGLLLGCTRSVASKFTFFLAIPVMFGASALKLVKYFIKGGTFGANEVAILGVGCVVAFVVSLIAIKWLMGFVRRHDFKCFGVYRIILGIVVLAYFFVLEPMLGL